MKDSFTLNELISFVCGEKNGVDMNHMETACKTNHRKFSKNELLDSGLSISPDKRIVNNILNYSRALLTVQTTSSGNFNLMMN